MTSIKSIFILFNNAHLTSSSDFVELDEGLRVELIFDKGSGNTDTVLFNDGDRVGSGFYVVDNEAVSLEVRIYRTRGSATQVQIDAIHLFGQENSVPTLSTRSFTASGANDRVYETWIS